VSETDDGGPAFPVEPHDEISTTFEYSSHPGMSLRDWFAGKAMQSILVGIECGPNDVANVVESAYILADAMMKQRQVKEVSE